VLAVIEVFQFRIVDTIFPEVSLGSVGVRLSVVTVG